jgi:ethanolamine utilization protein EutS
MEGHDYMVEMEKERIIQEYVPGKQITLAHLIANPERDIYTKLGLSGDKSNAIGILTITPGEGAIIAADISTKVADIEIGFLDRFSGSLVITGDVSSVETALNEVLNIMSKVLHFTPANITRT